jgi:hypothetical protein
MHAAVESAKYQIALLQALRQIFALVLHPPLANLDTATQEINAIPLALCPSLLDHTQMVVGAMILQIVLRRSAQITIALPTVQILTALVPVQVNAHLTTACHQTTLASRHVPQIRLQDSSLSAASVTTHFSVLLGTAMLMLVSPLAEETPVSLLIAPALLHHNVAAPSAHQVIPANLLVLNSWPLLSILPWVVTASKTMNV